MPSQSFAVEIRQHRIVPRDQFWQLRVQQVSDLLLIHTIVAHSCRVDPAKAQNTLLKIGLEFLSGHGGW